MGVSVDEIISACTLLMLTTISICIEVPIRRSYY